MLLSCPQGPSQTPAGSTSSSRPATTGTCSCSPPAAGCTRGQTTGRPFWTASGPAELDCALGFSRGPWTAGLPAQSPSGGGGRLELWPLGGGGSLSHGPGPLHVSPLSPALPGLKLISGQGWLVQGPWTGHIQPGSSGRPQAMARLGLGAPDLKERRAGRPLPVPQGSPPICSPSAREPALRCFRGERATSRSRWDKPSHSGPRPLPPLPSHRVSVPCGGPPWIQQTLPEFQGMPGSVLAPQAALPWTRSEVSRTHVPALGPGVSSLEHLLKAGKINGFQVLPHNVALPSPCPDIWPLGTALHIL